MNKVFLLFAIAILSACSTYSKKDCQAMDWHKQGLQAALNGKHLDDARETFEKQCYHENKVKPDEEKMKQGYDQGLKQFCTPENAYRLGSSGRSYASICPPQAVNPRHLRNKKSASSIIGVSPAKQ